MLDSEQRERLSVVVRGAVQGVGFRPFVYRLAVELHLTGWVNNSMEGVCLEVEGEHRSLEMFLVRLQKEAPPRASIQSVEFSFLDPNGYRTFEIRESTASGTRTTLILPDIATCPDCREEIFNTSNRRYLYPFTNCTNCGPRFTIIESLPYDRANTSMKSFRMCPECQREYDDPTNRRFHAQPNACSFCGPHLELWNAQGKILAHEHEALEQAVKALHDGMIVAVKGIGGFHLMADARDDAVVHRLRKRKHREEKPFALMIPSLEVAKQLCSLTELEERALCAPEAPIVLLRRTAQSFQLLSSAVAPNNPYLGIMLPYSPLHHILLQLSAMPLIATSGNISDEPICTDEREALVRLGGIADLFLVHNRPIVRHVDDSIVRLVLGRELLLRRARGYAPLPIPLRAGAAQNVLAVGAHLKNSVAVAKGKQIFISQHIGDLETHEAFAAFERVLLDVQRLYDSTPDIVACDLHPAYLSTQYAHSLSKPLIAVQHHHAHIVSCMAENQLQGKVLGVAWDGTGYGTDKTVWGGEFLLTSAGEFTRFATFRPFLLIGGEQAIKEPRRAALGVLYELYGEALFAEEEVQPFLKATFTPQELKLLGTMASRKINTAVTTSVGRLFDAVAALIGLRSTVHYEGQAAMELEFLATQGKNNDLYPIILHSENNRRDECCYRVEWSEMIKEILRERMRGIEQSTIAVKFHKTLAEAIVCVAQKAGEERIVLSGGCFQNHLLTECVVHRLRQEGFRPYWHQRVPPNDGGIALGQAVVAMAQKK